MGSSMSRRRGTDTTPASQSPSTAKRTGARWLYPLTALLLFLLFVSWVLLLSATSALQANCGSTGANRLWAGVGFFGATSCDQLYRYLWWTTWLTFFTFVLTTAALVSRFIHKFRSGLVGLLAITTVLLMERTDTMLYASEIAGGVSGSLAARARVWVAGGIIGAFAAGLLMLFVGIHNEEDSSDRRMYSSKGERTTTTTTTTAPRTTAPTTTVESYPTGPREAAPVTSAV